MDTPSRIKDVYIGLSDYRFCHNASHPDPETHKDLFVGREKVKERLKMLLVNTENASGAYLVAGYRGMGKTSLVERAIAESNDNIANQSKTFVKLDISLSQDNLRDQDVLRLMVRQLYSAWQEIMPPIFVEGYSNIARQMNLLINNLEYNVKKASSGTVSKREPFLKKVFRDSIIDELTRSAFQPKEIEKELIVILERINELREKDDGSFKIPQFIFIVDELDKIEPHYLYDHTRNAKDDDDVFGMNKVRGRQEEIARLLASLKSFLNTAKAKFIFIGGREMYDAALADIADRESFYSSIFHDVIYVPSFFKDKFTKRSGLTRLTEGYLCKVIIPIEYINAYVGIHLDKKEKVEEEWFDLKTVFHYLVDVTNAQSKESEWKFGDSQINEIEDVTKRNAIYKTLFLLQNFVIYLTYRSNGTPKKLVSLIEAFITSVSEDRLKNALDTHIVFLSPQMNSSGKKRQLFIRFSYNQQYEVGLTCNLYRPYAIIHSRYTKSLGDKLLYSTAYVFDYMLKFHPHAFSWRNLEMMPEIILINKDPNLRYYLEDVLKYLSGMYIRETVNSIFQYKFFNRAANEIKLLTKISEPASAAFNFTLDESLQVKSYYRRRLKQLQASNPGYTNTFIHSISFVQSILADLHYFDKEYDEAIIYHSDAIQVLRQHVQAHPDVLTKHQTIKYVRHKLLLGLCLEKIKAFDSAYSIYRGLILNIPTLLDKVTNNDEAYHEDEDFSQILNEQKVDEQASLSQKNIKRVYEGWDKPIRRMQLFIRPHIALLDVIEKQRMDGITYANLLRNFRDVHDFLIEKQENPTPRKQENLTPTKQEPPPPTKQRKSKKEEPQTIVQVESEIEDSIKEEPQTIVQVELEIGDSIDVEDAKKNIKIDANRVHTLLADYYNHVGMLLFFKNRNFPELYDQFEKLNYLPPNNEASKSMLKEESELQQEKGNSTESLHDFRSKMLGGNTSINKDYLPSLSALAYYLRALREAMRCYDREIEAIHIAFSGSYNKDKETDLSRAIFLLFPEAVGLVNATGFYTLGNLFSRIGDTLLASMPQNPGPAECDISNPVLTLYGDKSRNEVIARSSEPTILTNIHQLVLKKTHLRDFFSLDFILLMYRVAGYFYNKSGRNYSYAFHYKKFLYVVKDYVSVYATKEKLDEFREVGPLSEILKNCCVDVAERIFNINTWITDVANRPQILKYREIFKGDSLPTHEAKDETRVIYKNLSNSPEIRETIALVEEIKLKIDYKTKLISALCIPNVIGAYDLVTNQYSRIAELRYQCTANFFKLEQMGYRWIVKSITSDLRILGLLDDNGTIKPKTKAIILELEKNIHEKADYNLTEETSKDAVDALRKATYFNSVINERIEAYRDLIKLNSDDNKDLFKRYFGEFYFEDKLKKLIELAEINESDLRDKEIDIHIVKEISELKKCICDTIFCLFETIRTLNLFGINYITNNSYLANAHYKLANWCQAYLNYDILIDRPLKKYRKKKDASGEPEGGAKLLPIEIKKTLRKILEEEDLSFLEPNYHNEMAIQYYYASLQTHTGGKTYRNLNQSMSFLEDNFNDNLTHFCAATERFRMNSGVIRWEIKKLKGKINHSSIYVYNNYLDHD